jgi:hypothetical protein
MLGKIRLALSPAQPNWMSTALYLNARGITTGAIPWEDASIEATIDVFTSEIVIARSDGSRRNVPLLPPRTVAGVYAALKSALEELGVACFISPVPQEVADTTPFDEDRAAPAYDAAAVVRWFQAATAIAGVFDAWRAHFFGRTGIQLWWGAFDISLMLFNGHKVRPPADRGYLFKYDLDAELMTAGFYLGDETNAPLFFGYIYPQPPGAEALPIAPNGASWSTQLSEWVLPYDAVRAAADPSAELRAFLDALYERCIDAAGWDREALSYLAPKPRRL